MTARRLQRITGFALVTADLRRLVHFYCGVLGFEVLGAETSIAGDDMRLLGLSGGGRRQRLGLGAQTLWIEQFDLAGRPYPADGDAAALWFQHLAIVVDDMPAAFARLRDVTPISQGGPQLLPESSGGVCAYKFRDPDLHPLELLQFPADTTPGIWRNRHRQAGQIGLGIDHSAISVADAQVSAAFYRALGLEIGASGRNEGPAQQALDGLPDVAVDVVPLVPPHGTPHLELLGYRRPKCPAGPPLFAHDVAATRILWAGGEAALLRDPDGHLQQVGP